ncbi:MAG TPA: FtsX-like permease family protein, partial [Gemmatimonadales bacterium]|nr:FtsX-like permease family protein [Gemmatimonadales bacterium]
LAFGLVPALRAAGVDPGAALKEGGRSGSTLGEVRHGRLRKLLVACEVGLSLIVLVGAGLLVRSYRRIIVANPGFDPHQVLSFRVSLPGLRYQTPESVSQFFAQVQERLARLPGVVSVGSNYQLPLSSVALAWEPIGIEGYVPRAAGDDLIISSSAYVSPDYFRAMGIPLLHGRFFTAQDNRESPQVVIVDDKLAARFWPGEDAVGKRLRQGSDGPWRTVIGVVANDREYGVGTQPPITCYFPVEQYVIRSRFIVLRTGGTAGPASLTGPAMAALHEVDPDLPAYDVSTMAERLRDSLARRRLSMLLLTAFAGFALLLSAIGTYGVIACWVDQRRREIGIRMALGADAGRILRLVALEVLPMVAAGLAAGLFGALALTRVMTSMLFGVGARDTATFVIIPALIALVALLATWVPARQATALEPVAVLRDE